MPLSKKKMSRMTAQEKSMAPRTYNPAKAAKNSDTSDGTRKVVGAGSTKKARASAVKTAIKASVKNQAAERKDPSLPFERSVAMGRESDKAAVAGRKGAPMTNRGISSDGMNRLKLGSGQRKTVEKRISQSVKATTPAKKKK